MLIARGTIADKVAGEVVSMQGDKELSKARGREGLGSDVVKGSVELHEGKMTVASEPSKVWLALAFPPLCCTGMSMVLSLPIRPSLNNLGHVLNEEWSV